MGQLSIAVLGPPVVRHAGREVTFPTRKSAALLLYLVVEGRPQARARLSPLFWPESSTANGRAALRVSLAHLRTALDEAADGVSHLLSERGLLGVNAAAAHDCDLHTFWHALAPVDRPATAGDRSAETRGERIAGLRAATDLYRGEFLDTFALSDAPAFDEWASTYREACHLRMGEIYEHLTRLYIDSGAVAEAIDSATRWLAHHPLNESAYRRLMQAQFMGGDRAGALRTYEACRVVLARDLQVAPLPQTAALAERIRLSTPRRAQARPPVAPPPATPPFDTPLVGRAHEFGRLIEAYYAAGRTGVQVAVLDGEAGAGKTRLATEFLGWATAHGADVMESRAFETGGQLPYQPFVDALRKRVAATNAPDDLLSDTWLAELSRLLPELRDRYPDLPMPTSDESTARVRLFEAMACLGLALSARATLVLFLDDLQWADAASLDALHYLARRWMESEARILVLLTLRGEALAATPALSAWLLTLGRLLPPIRLPLDALTAEETVHLVSALYTRAGSTAQSGAWSAVAGATGSGGDVVGFSRWLFAATHGHPFHITEMLKTLVERGVLAVHIHDDGRWGCTLVAPADLSLLRDLIPHGVREVVRARLSHVSASAAAVAAAGAVLGREFTFEFVCRVAGLEEDDGLAALDQALAHRVLRETVDMDTSGGPREATYVFVHDTIRDVVYADLSAARRRVLHRRAFEALRDAQAVPARLAHHAHAAGLAAPAFTYSLLAGAAALRLFALRDAVASYQQACGLIATQAYRESTAADLQQLYTGLGRAFELGSQYAQARDAYQAMLAAARAADLPAMAASALTRLATLAVQDSTEPAAALEILDEALREAERSGDRAVLAETAWSLAHATFHAWRPRVSFTHGQRALALAQELAHQDLIARSLNVLAVSTVVLGKVRAAEAYAVEALALYAARGDRAMEADTLGHLSIVHLHRGRPRDALAAADRMRAISEEIGSPWGRVISLVNLAAAWRDIGAYGDALTGAQEAVTMARGQESPFLLMLSLTVLGTVHRALLALEAARAAHQEAMHVAGRMVPRFAEQAAAELCADHALAGEWAEARRYARQALAVRDYTFIPGAGLTRPYETTALLWDGEEADVRDDLRNFVAHIGAGRRWRVSYLRSCAALAHRRGERDHEIAHLLAAATLADTIGLPGEQWVIEAALADAYDAQHQREQARRALTCAAAVIQRLADALDDAASRSTFLAAPQVRAVLDQVADG